MPLSNKYPRRERGQTMTELTMLLPVLLILFFAFTQIFAAMQSANSTYFAAFFAARAYQVYGARTLGSLGLEHRRLGTEPMTNENQTIVEAAAERIIFETLLWEHRKVHVAGDDRLSMDRLYEDGNDLSVNHASATSNDGAVRVNLRRGLGVDVTYCMPMVSGLAAPLMELAKKSNPCSKRRTGRSYDGIAITKSASLGVEPEVAP